MSTNRDSNRIRRGERPVESRAHNGGAKRLPAADVIVGAEDASPGSRLFTSVLQAAVIALAVLWIYSPVCDSTGPLYLPGLSPVYPVDWLWDDDQLLTANPTVQHRLSADPAAPPAHLATLLKLWFYPDGADYFPLSYTALWAQWPFFQMDPRTGGPVQPGGPAVAWPTGYHVTTVLLHLLGALSLWKLFSVLKLPGAWLGALLFAVHPVCVESVAWVSELKNTLSLPLFLWSAIHYIRFDELTQDADAQATPRALRHYLASIALFLLAMFAKTSVVAMPVLILFYAWWKRNTVTIRDGVAAAPFFLISFVLGVITIYYQHGRAIGQETIIVGGLDSRLASAGMSILWYMKLLAWPIHLLPIYTKWEVDPPKVWQFLPWPVIAAVGWWFWQNRSTWGRNALFAFGFFLLMVAPVLGFITISYMRITWAADHFIYLPMISLVGLVAAGVATWYDRTSAEEKPFLVAGISVVIAALTLLSYNYAGCWVHEDALWTHTLTYNENAWQAHNRLGAKKFARGHVETFEPSSRIQNLGAFHHFTRSTALRPDLGETHNNLGTAWSARAQMAGQRGDQAAAKQCMDKAIEQFAEACRVTPHVPAIHVNLANALAAAGRFDEAAKKYKELLEQAPDNAALWNNYGVALFKKGDKAPAIEAFRKALSIDPNLKDAKESLAVATGQAEAPQQPGPPQAQPVAPPRSPGEQLQLNPPQSPTLGPSPLLQR